jgi:hypothetical protein
MKSYKEVILTEITDFTKKDWEDFQQLPCYQFLLQELKERDSVVSQALRKGDPEFGSDDKLRGRLDELDFILSTVGAFIEELELLENAEKVNKSNKEEGDE